MRQTVCRAAYSSRVESNCFRLSLFDNATQRSSDLRARRCEYFEEILQVFFTVTNQSYSLQLVTASIGKDKKLASSRIRERRSNVGRYWICVKLFVHHDPHVDLF